MIYREKRGSISNLPILATRYLKSEHKKIINLESLPRMPPSGFVDQRRPTANLNTLSRSSVCLSVLRNRGGKGKQVYVPRTMLQNEKSTRTREGKKSNCIPPRPLTATFKPFPFAPWRLTGQKILRCDFIWWWEVVSVGTGKETRSVLLTTWAKKRAEIMRAEWRICVAQVHDWLNKDSVVELQSFASKPKAMSARWSCAGVDGKSGIYFIGAKLPYGCDGGMPIDG